MQDPVTSKSLINGSYYNLRFQGSPQDFFPVLKILRCLDFPKF